MWMRRVLPDLQYPQEEPTIIYCDNSFAIALSKRHVFHQHSIHIDIRYHYIRELVNKGDICLKFCRSTEKLADIFTKPLTKNVFEHLQGSIGMVGED